MSNTAQRVLYCALLLFAVVFSDMLPAATSRPAPGKELTPMVLQLKWKHQFQFAGYYAAIEKGYYRDAGLDVSLCEAEPGKDPIHTVLEGKADFGVGTSELILERNKGEPVVVLAAIYQHSPLVLLARADAKVEDIQALADQLIMIEPQSAELLAYFKYEGVDPATLKIVPHTFNVADLLAGKVSAMSAYSTDEPFLVNKAGVPTMVFTPRSGGIDFYGDNLFTTEETARNHPERVKAFLDASLKGWEYAMEHPGEIVDLILRKYNTQGKSRDHLLYEAKHTALLMHPKLIEIGHMNKGRWKHIASTYEEFGMLPKDFSLKGFLYEPNLQQDRKWIVGLLVLLAIFIFAAVLWVLPLLRLNMSLRSQIKERQHVEALLRESEQQYRLLAEHVPFPVAITDMETQQLLFANRRSTDLMEVEHDKATGMRPSDFYVNSADRDHLLAQLHAGKPVNNFEVKLRTQSGRIIWTLMSAAFVEFSGRKGMVVAFQDITALRTLQGELEQSKEAAESANAAKSNYLAVMSHELRSPISGVIGLANLMMDDSLTQEQRENLALIATTGESLNKLISDILDHSKLETGHMEVEMERVNMEEFIHSLCRLFGAPAQVKNIEMDCGIAPEVPAVIITDSMRLHQILGNLVTNAVKFTKEGRVDLNATAEPLPPAGSPTRKWQLRFEVRDTGIGIAPEHLSRLFKPYSQAESSTARRYGGTGLGLAISQKLAALLGGKISVESEPGKGSAFLLEIIAEEAVAEKAV